MKRKICFAILFSAILFSFKNDGNEERIRHEFSGENGKVNYETKNNLFDGDYFSFYKNGKPKAEGKFLNNQRTGSWTVYDSLGNEKVQREYKDNFTFTQIFPEVPDNGPISLLNEPIYKPAYNKNGYIDYFYINERAVMISKRIWRRIEVKDNGEIFRNNNFIHAVVDSLIAKKIIAYADDEFHDTISKQNFERLCDTSSYNVIAYEIKEDWFFDNDRMISESRIIGISPVVLSRNRISDGDGYEYHLGWFYFPYLRNTMAKIKTGKNVPADVHSLDDLFFYRYFHGDIFKESNIYDRPLADYPEVNDIQKERERIEISMIEMEHDTWLRFVK